MAEFDITKVITATDIAAAITAGVIAYIRNSATSADDGGADPTNFQDCKADFDSAMKAGRLFKQTNGYWTQYDDSGKAIGVFREVRGGLCKYAVGDDGTITGGTFFKPDGTMQQLQQFAGPNRAVQVWTNHHNAIEDQLASGGMACDPYTTTVGQDPDFDKSFLDSIGRKLSSKMANGGYQLSKMDQSEALDAIMDYADTNDLTQAQVSSMVNRLGPSGLAKLAQLDDRGFYGNMDDIMGDLAKGSTKALDVAWGKRALGGVWSSGSIENNF